MDFYSVIDRLMPQIKRLITVLNDPAIDPTLRKAALTAGFQQIGQSVYGKAYNMTAWDLEIAETLGRGWKVEIAQGLARNISTGIATGDGQLALDQAKNYVQQSASTAMFEASETGKQLGKYRTVTRSIRRETCRWCLDRAGTYTNPTAEIFRRHTHCDCLIKVEGYRSRNGLLQNYRTT